MEDKRRQTLHSYGNTATPRFHIGQGGIHFVLGTEVLQEQLNHVCVCVCVCDRYNVVMSRGM